MADKVRNDVRVVAYCDEETVKKIDEFCEKGGMSRSEFVATALEIVVDADGPLIDFSFRLGRLAKKIWPSKSQKPSRA